MPAVLRKIGTRTGIAALLLAVLASQADAGGFLIRDQTAAGFGMAIAGAAAGGDLSYIFWNPAILDQSTTMETQSVITGLALGIDVRPDAATNALVTGLGGTPTTSTDIGTKAVVTAAYSALPISDQLTLGLAMNSPFGLSTSAPHYWAGQVYSQDSSIFSIDFNPMFSYRFSDRLVIGGGVQLQYMSAFLSQALGVGPSPSAVIEASDVDIGFNLGVTLKPVDGTEIGIGYRSSISHELLGEMRVAGAVMGARAFLDTPDVLSLGVRQRLTNRFTLAGTVEYDGWSRVGFIPVRSTATGATLTTLPLNYEDGWYFSVGGEYKMRDNLLLRAGVGYEMSPINDRNRSTTLPEPDQVVVSAGLSYDYNPRLKLDLGYSYVFGVGGADINLVPGHAAFNGLPFTGSASLDAHIVSASLKYKFKTPPRVR